MNTSHLIALGLSFVFALPSVTFGARAVSDLAPPAKRQASVDLAERLAKHTPPAPMPADLRSPFNPPDFEAPDPAERRAAPVAAGAGAAAVPEAPPQPVGPVTDRETLEALAAQIVPSGMIQLRGAPLLLIGGKRFEIGTRFTVMYGNQEYELELVNIERTTFTLRYRNEDITRPIKPVR
jgi:hypothetical protein